MYINIYAYIYMYICIYRYIYVYIYYKDIWCDDGRPQKRSWAHPPWRSAPMLIFQKKTKLFDIIANVRLQT